ncbi:hypothetical protein ACFQ3P_38535 [Paraburkholderia sabiae]|uniref:DUF2335 domain-containing protein n=1 Tax=Paraburkholderia sabiae TaxID=273251 RepID=A0ABU9QPS2_9BURK|nr:hypothetical protein [Paraburkholderia sabiae]WJZ74390.1 hypothetical protein QEN71_00820 [Paraburkholderia sabiae]CAD6562645.1 hypothetical protein LMG24235_07884 [Paraburkholderia sabiae]
MNTPNQSPPDQFPPPPKKTSKDFEEDSKKLIEVLKAVPSPTVIGQDGLFTLCALIIMTETDAARREKLIDQIRKMSGVDRWTFRSAIWILGGIAVVAAGSLVAFGILKTPTDYIAGVLSVASACVAGLAGLLTPRGR